MPPENPSNTSSFDDVSPEQHVYIDFPPIHTLPKLHMAQLIPCPSFIFSHGSKSHSHSTKSFIPIPYELQTETYQDICFLLEQISSDLTTLLTTSFGDFWALLNVDSSIVPALQSIIAYLPSYLHYDSSPQTSMNESRSDFDKSTCLFEMYSFLTESSTTTTTTSTSSNVSNPTQSTTTSSSQSPFLTTRFTTIISSIYINTLLLFVRATSPHAVFIDRIQLNQCHVSTIATSSLAISHTFWQPSDADIEANVLTVEQRQAQYKPIVEISLFQHQQLLQQIGLFSPLILINLLGCFVGSHNDLLAIIVTRLARYTWFERDVLTICLDSSLYLLCLHSSNLSSQLNEILSTFQLQFQFEHQHRSMDRKELQKTFQPLSNDIYQSLSIRFGSCIGALYTIFGCLLLLPQQTSRILTRPMTFHSLLASLQAAQKSPHSLSLSSTLSSSSSTTLSLVQLSQCSQILPLSIFIRFFDYIIPSIAQIFHIDCLYTLYMQEDDDSSMTETSSTTMTSTTTSTSTSTTTTTTSTASTTTTSTPAPTDPSHVSLFSTWVGRESSPWSFPTFRSHKYFSYPSYLTMYSAFLLFNNGILHPLGLQLSYSDVASALFHLTPEQQQQQSQQTSQQQSKFNSKQPQIIPPGCYIPPGIPLSNDRVSDNTVIENRDQHDALCRILVTALSSLVSPQQCPSLVSTISPLSNATSSQSTPSSPLYEYPMCSDFAFPGALFYYLPISSVIVLFQQINKLVHTTPRPPKPLWIPISVVSTFQDIEAKINQFFPIVATSSSSSALSSSAKTINSECSPRHITSWAQLSTFLIHTLTLFEECWSDQSLILFHQSSLQYNCSSSVAPLTSAVSKPTGAASKRTPAATTSHWASVYKGPNAAPTQSDDNVETFLQNTKGGSHQKRFQPTSLVPFTAAERAAFIRSFNVMHLDYNDDADDSIDAPRVFLPRVVGDDADSQPQDDSAAAAVPAATNDKSTSSKASNGKPTNGKTTNGKGKSSTAASAAQQTGDTPSEPPAVVPDTLPPPSSKVGRGHQHIPLVQDDFDFVNFSTKARERADNDAKRRLKQAHNKYKNGNDDDDNIGSIEPPSTDKPPHSAGGGKSKSQTKNGHNADKHTHGANASAGGPSSSNQSKPKNSDKKHSSTRGKPKM